MATTDSDGRTPLHAAALAADDGASLRELLAAGPADPAVADHGGWTPLHCAASAGRSDAVEQLVRAGSPLDACTEAGSSALTYAASKGHTAVVRTLLGAAADVTVRDRSGCTPLHRAASRGHADAVQLLLQQQPSQQLELKDKRGHTAFHLAVLEQQESVAVLLAEAGADPKTKNSDGECAADSLPPRLLQQFS